MCYLPATYLHTCFTKCMPKIIYDADWTPTVMLHNVKILECNWLVHYLDDICRRHLLIQSMKEVLDMQRSSLCAGLPCWSAESLVAPRLLTSAQFSPHLTHTAQHHCNRWIVQHLMKRSWWGSPYFRFFSRGILSSDTKEFRTEPYSFNPVSVDSEDFHWWNMADMNFND